MVKTYAVIENGIVVNVTLAETDFAAEQGWVLLPPYVFVGWLYDGQTFSPPTDIAPTYQELSALRAEAYRAEADPLFFKAQRGEATMDEWLAKVAEIKARYPYPEEV
jgi:hypothetical protein